MPLVCMICTGMYGSGVKIGMAIILRVPLLTPRAQIPVNTVCCVVGLSSVLLGFPARLTASTTRLITGSSILGSVLRGLINYCLFLYCFTPCDLCLLYLSLKSLYEVEKIKSKANTPLQKVFRRMVTNQTINKLTDSMLQNNLK